MSDLIHRFSAEIAGELEGWVAPRQPLMVGLVDAIQRERGVTGDIVEIGVHHGLFTMLLAAVRRDGETVRAFDVFEDQAANIDASGSGSREIFESAIARWYDPAHFIVTQADSLDMRGAAIGRHLPDPVRLFSVDGGHTRVHAANDLMIANDVMTPGGIVILDDFFAVLWTGVTEGFFDFMRAPGVKLAPLCYFENKLYITTAAEQPDMLVALRAKLDEAIGAEMHNGLWKYIELAGYKALVRA